MSSVLDHPADADRKPLIADSGRVLENDGLQAQRYMLKLCREEAQKVGHDLAGVYVVHRISGKARPWDMRGPDAMSYAEALCSGEWRIATAEEARAAREADKQTRHEIAKAKLNYEAAAVNQLAGQLVFRKLVDEVNAPPPVSAPDAAAPQKGKK